MHPSDSSRDSLIWFYLVRSEASLVYRLGKANIMYQWYPVNSVDRLGEKNFIYSNRDW